MAMAMEMGRQDWAVSHMVRTAPRPCGMAAKDSNIFSFDNAMCFSFSHHWICLYP